MLTLSSNPQPDGGTVQITYNSGTQTFGPYSYLSMPLTGDVSALAIPAPGYAFVNWSLTAGGSPESTDNPWDFTVGADETLRYYANFASNDAPEIICADRQTGVAGTGKTFNLGSFTDGDTGDTWNINVNWGDGTADTDFSMDSAGTIIPQSHTYNSMGNYSVQVTVNDGTGSDSCSFSVEVSAASIPTINEWGMIVMSLILAWAAFCMMRRRQIS
jgi:PKD repeat protein